MVDPVKRHKAPIKARRKRKKPTIEFGIWQCQMAGIESFQSHLSQKRRATDADAQHQLRDVCFHQHHPRSPVNVDMECPKQQLLEIILQYETMFPESSLQRGLPLRTLYHYSNLLLSGRSLESTNTARQMPGDSDWFRWNHPYFENPLLWTRLGRCKIAAANSCNSMWAR